MKGRDEFAASFVDDTVYAVMADNMEEGIAKLREMLEREGGGIEWLTTHFSPYEYTKFGLVGFSRKKEDNPDNPGKKKEIERPSLTIGDTVIQPSKSYKYLGVILDQELRFQQHALYAVGKGTTWANQFKRVARMSRGVEGKLCRQLYLGVGIPSMLYAAEVWCEPSVAEKGGRMTLGARGMVNKLEKVQRMALLQVTGALRTTPTDLLEIHAEIPPINMKIREMCQRAALRLATLPKTHPLYFPVRQAYTFFVRRHKSPMHFVMRCLERHPREIEEVHPIRRHPTQGTTIKTRIDHSKEEAKEKLREIEADVKVYTDGSGEDGKIGAAAVLYRGFRAPKVMRLHLGPDTEHTVYEGECVGQIMAVELIRRETEQVKTALILSDNQASIRALNTTTAGPGHDIVDRVVREIEQLDEVHKGIAVGVMWTPGHEGIEGNERADAEAKRASQGQSSQRLPPYLRKPLRISKSAWKQELQRRLKEDIKAQFEKSPRYVRMMRIDPHALSSKFRKKAMDAPRRQSSLLIQLRTGHVPLNQYLHRFKKVESPICPACNNAIETPAHFLIQCPAYRQHRIPLRRDLKGAASSITQMLSNDKAWKSLFQYIDATGRFQESHGQMTQREPPKMEHLDDDTEDDDHG